MEKSRLIQCCVKVYWKVDALTDYMSLDNNLSFDMFCIEAFQKWPNAQKQKNKSP